MIGTAQNAPVLEDPRGDPFKAAQNGYEFLKQLQSPDGHWSAEYGGPLFLVRIFTEQLKPLLTLGVYAADPRHDNNSLRDSYTDSRRMED